MGKEDGIVIDIRYKTAFTVNEFANYIFEVIKGSDNVILNDYYKHLIPFYSDAVQSEDSKSFILGVTSKKYVRRMCIYFGDQFFWHEENEICCIDLYIQKSLRAS